MTRLIATLAVAATAAAAATASPAWNVSIPQFATIAMSVAATAPGTVLCPIADNGQGSMIVRSTDGGATFNTLPAPQSGGYLGGSAVGNSACAAGFFGLYGSDLPSGYNFSASTGVVGVTSQSVEAFGTQSYGATGQSILGGGNGVAVSTDGGSTFTWHNVSELTTDARYGAFPTADTWYLSAGSWPSNAKQSNGKAISSRLTVRGDEMGRPRVEFENAQVGRPVTNTSSGWSAQIVKTTDAGKTWTSVFEGNGAGGDAAFYFNAIDCADAMHCVAVAESDAGPEPGIRAFTTADGGKTWKRTMYQNDPSDSIFAARFVSATEVWIAGGHLVETDFVGYYFHSTDAGATWTRVEVPNAYGVSLSFVSSGEGYATALNIESQSSFLTYA